MSLYLHGKKDFSTENSALKKTITTSFIYIYLLISLYLTKNPRPIEESEFSKEQRLVNLRNLILIRLSLALSQQMKPED